jgi:uncharacterized membrane protein YjjP (DUF1212 family)
MVEDETDIVVELEQLILSGINDDTLDEEGASKVFKELTKFSDKYTYLFPSVVCRILCIFLCFYHINQDEW